ncbi:hypothetical protein CPAV1605_939 [seawater metagenome]|uniref:Uncharacterized protein n=1 Tax=seawater metagenome TaxID=1561972 RepID=A0A5E8CKI8_9ZZZZ
MKLAVFSINRIALGLLKSLQENPNHEVVLFVYTDLHTEKFHKDIDAMGYNSFLYKTKSEQNNTELLNILIKNKIECNIVASFCELPKIIYNEIFSINLHLSVLPAFQGSYPVQGLVYALNNIDQDWVEDSKGVTVHKITGSVNDCKDDDILLIKYLKQNKSRRIETLLKKLQNLGYRAINEALKDKNEDQNKDIVIPKTKTITPHIPASHFYYDTRNKEGIFKML